jgi:AraC-like DNA-binding protein
MVEFDGKKFPVRPGEAFLLPVPEKHLYYLPDKPGNWEFLYLRLEGCETMRIGRELRKLLPPVSSAYASKETVELARELIRRTGDNEFAHPSEVSRLVYDFMLSLLAGNRNDSLPSGKDTLLRVHQFCVKNLTAPLNIEVMAEAAGYSRSHFCRVFRELSGQSPHEYLLALRIRTAVRMLQNNSLNIKTIAAKCGFPETGYFCKVFRRFTGTTPAEFRHQNFDQTK